MGKTVEQAKKKLPRSGFVHLARGPTIKTIKIIADIKRISYIYPGRFTNVKPKTKRRYTMKVFQAAKIWMEYHKANSKKKYHSSLQVDFSQIL